MSDDHKDVMISSTSCDLPDHREQVRDACLRMDMFPIMMEDLAASGADAIRASLAMVDEAEIFILILAHRYGYIPAGHEISVTQMEYDRAVERGIPRLCYVMGDDHDIKISDVDTGESAEKLKVFKDRVLTENIVNFFTSPEDLRGHIVHGLSNYRERAERGAKMHHISDILAPPADYIAHPYTLLQARGLVGRQRELNILTDWITGSDRRLADVRMLNVVAIGGMGKSALTWHWFHKIAPQEKKFEARMWWSFYESDARFENFVIRALAYLSERPREEIESDMKRPEREDQLIALLNKRPTLLVLDGLERILLAYARMDASRLADDDLDVQTANRVVGALGLPDSAAQSFVGEGKLRQTVDLRAGQFLRRLAGVKGSRILVSTRLFPVALQMVTGSPMPGTHALFLPGLSEDDALDLWRELGVSGSRDELLPYFESFEYHPLLIETLAGEVARFRKKPGDFDAWRAEYKEFNPVALASNERKTHVLSYAMRGLDSTARSVLETVAAFRAPADYDTLAGLLIRKADETDEDGEAVAPPTTAIYDDERELDAALGDLEDRGLLGWDRIANRYDLHPIVRGVAWGRLDEDDKRGIYGALAGHFEAMPVRFDQNNYHQVKSLEDLSPAIEFYRALVGVGQYDEAALLFYERLENAMHFTLGSQRQRIELLERLFPDGVDALPRLNRPDYQAWTLNALALAYDTNGQPGRAAPLYQHYISISEEREDQHEISNGLSNLSDAVRLAGGLYIAEAAARRALSIVRQMPIKREREDHFREAVSLYWLGLALSLRGVEGESETALRRSIRIFQQINQYEGIATAFLAQCAIWFGDAATARPLAEQAWELAHVQNVEADFIRSARLQGEAAALLGEDKIADERLNHALARARAISRVEDELPALIALAGMRHRQGKTDEARALLDNVWDSAERGPYPTFAADGRNLLAHIERDAGNTEAAIEAAREAYRLAWCDGPPYAYHRGLEAAKSHLAALGVDAPDMPAFDAEGREEMVAVEIDP